MALPQPSSGWAATCEPWGRAASASGGGSPKRPSPPDGPKRARPSRWAGRNAGGASQPASATASTKTPSVTQAWRCTRWLSAEPKRCGKETAPSLGRVVAGESVAFVTPAAAHSDRSISSRKIFVRAATAAGQSASMPRNRLGTEITHCRAAEGLVARGTAVKRDAIAPLHPAPEARGKFPRVQNPLSPWMRPYRANPPRRGTNIGTRL